MGKTALVCGVIAALPEFAWTVVKITGHDYEPDGDAGVSDQIVWEETSAGTETDTARYLAAGARRALLVTRCGPGVPIDEIRMALGDDRNIIFESNRIVDVVKPDVCLALTDDAREMKASFARLLRVTDAVVTLGRSESPPEGLPLFELEPGDRLPTQMVEWLQGMLVESQAGLEGDRSFFPLDSRG